MGPTSWAYTTCDSIEWEEEREKKKRRNKKKKKRIGKMRMEEWKDRKRLSCGLKRERKKWLFIGSTTSTKNTLDTKIWQGIGWQGGRASNMASLH